MPTKFHRPLLQAVDDILFQTFTTSYYAEKILDATLKSNVQWGKRDRAFIAETVFECVRWWRYYGVLCGFNSETDGVTLETVKKIIGVHLILKEDADVVHPFFDDLPMLSTLKSSTEKKLSFAERAAFPDWLNTYAGNFLGAATWQNEAMALNYVAPIVLRCNTLKISVAELQTLLSENEIPTHRTALFADALVVEGRANVIQLDAFKNGFFEIQDAGSQCIAPFLKLNDGDFLIDACAGAGGKTLHAANLMHQTGRVLALDIHQNKLNELQKRAKRQGIKNVETRLITSEKIIAALKSSADAVLLDVPCSGLGVLRRQPDTKWKLKPQLLHGLQKSQAHILATYSTMARVGGCVVYATCSILPSENAQQVEQFLTQTKNFILEEERTISPFKDGFDGFYMARLRRVY